MKAPIKPQQPSEEDTTVSVKPATEARQGVSGQKLRYVLWVALAAVIIAFALAYVFSS